MSPFTRVTLSLVGVSPLVILIGYYFYLRKSNNSMDTPEDIVMELARSQAKSRTQGLEDFDMGEPNDLSNPLTVSISPPTSEGTSPLTSLDASPNSSLMNSASVEVSPKADPSRNTEVLDYQYDFSKLDISEEFGAAPTQTSYEYSSWAKEMECSEAELNSLQETASSLQIKDSAIDATESMLTQSPTRSSISTSDASDKCETQKILKTNRKSFKQKSLSGSKQPREAETLVEKIDSKEDKSQQVVKKKKKKSKRHLKDLVTASPVSDASLDSGLGVDQSQLLWECEYPREFSPLIIGKQGRNVKSMMYYSGAKIFLRDLPYESEFQNMTIEGTVHNIGLAIEKLNQVFPDLDLSSGVFYDKHYNYVHLAVSSGAVVPRPLPCPPPETTRLPFPEGVAINVIISYIVDAGRIFVQQPMHPSHSSITELDRVMLALYGDEESKPPSLPTPILANMVCAAPAYNKWCRAQVINANEDGIAGEGVFVKFVDHGGYRTLPVDKLKQIRSDLVSLPFQAQEVLLANVRPAASEQMFSEAATSFFHQSIQGKHLLVEVKGYSPDGIPLVDLYASLTSDPENTDYLLVNHELVSSGNAVWMEGDRETQEVVSSGNAVWMEGERETHEVVSSGNAVWMEGERETQEVVSSGNAVWMEGERETQEVVSSGNAVWMEGERETPVEVL